MKIWCLFSIENAYDQPPNNLVAWWKEKPSLEQILRMIGGDISNEDAVLTAAACLDDRARDYHGTEYRLSEISEGVVRE